MEKIYKPLDMPVLCLKCNKPIEDGVPAQDFVVPGRIGFVSSDRCGWCDFAFTATTLPNGDIQFKNKY